MANNTTQKGSLETMTDIELYEDVCKMIIETYGIQGFRRYIRLTHENVKGRDYVKETENLFNDVTVEDIFNKATDHKEVMGK